MIQIIVYKGLYNIGSWEYWWII